MSAPFEFTFSQPTMTPDLCGLLDEYLTGEYGEDALVAGHLAFDADNNLLDVRTYLVGHPLDRSDPAEYPYGDGAVAHRDVAEWMKTFGEDAYTMTFSRRPHATQAAGPLVPNEADLTLSDAVANMSRIFGYTFRGHVFTNGRAHGLIVDPADNRVAQLADLGINVVDVDEGDDELSTIDAIRQALEAIGANPNNPFELPDTKERPDVPPAFYN